MVGTVNAMFSITQQAISNFVIIIRDLLLPFLTVRRLTVQRMKLQRVDWPLLIKKLLIGHLAKVRKMEKKANTHWMILSHGCEVIYSMKITAVIIING